MELTGKAVIVTGSSRGIGEAVARRLAGLGAGVVIHSAKSRDDGEAVAADLPDAIYVQGDSSDGETAVALVRAAEERWGRLDGLVNNAATTIPVPPDDIAGVTAEHWNVLLATNVTGPYLMAQAALPLLKASGDGWIINMASVAGVRQIGSSLPYSVSKAALNHMTGLLAKHVGPEVRVNAIAPGLVATAWTADWHAQHEGVRAVAPLRRVATPEDIAEACLSIIRATYVTGQVLVVDGGLSLVL